MELISEIEQSYIEGCKRNDRKSQELLYKKYFRKMFLMCSRYSADETIICEIINDAFLNVFKNIAKFENRGSLEGWIRRITFNALADHFRREKRDIKFIFVEENDLKNIPVSHSNDLVFDYDDILSKINTLDGSFKSVFIKYAIEGYNHKEIGEELHISEGTSKWYLSEARKKLQKLFNLQTKQLKYGR